MLRYTGALGLCLLAFGCAAAVIQEAGPAFPIATAESQGLSPEALAGLVDEVNGYVERDLIVGAELLVIKNRRTVLHECFGHSDREDGELWHEGTVCNIRSMTKPVTGAAIQILVDRGLLSLDDPVAMHLPGFDTDAARDITVRQVITHRAGIPTTVLQSMTDHPDLVAMGNAVGEKGPEFTPGAKFWYSDSGTDVLGALVEVVSGRTVDEFVRDELLDPLGMTESFYYVDEEDPRRAEVAAMYGGGAGNWQRFLNPDEETFYPYAWGSQSLYSTPVDYAKFLAMWMDGGRANGRPVLSEAAVARTLTPVSEMTLIASDARFPTVFLDHEVYYGQMSVLHVPIAAGGAGPATVVGHSGSDGTVAWAWPARDLMVLFFTQSRGSGTVLRFEAAVDRLLINAGARAAAPGLPADQFRYLGTYIADYAQHMKEEFVVMEQSGRLAIDVPSQMILELEPAEEPGKWCFALSKMTTVWFEEDEHGQVDCLRIQQGPMVFDVPRKGTPRERDVADANRVDPDEVAKYLGKYDDPDSEEHMEILIDGDYLAADVPEAQLLHLWKIPGQDAWLV